MKTRRASLHPTESNLTFIPFHGSRLRYKHIQTNTASAASQINCNSICTSGTHRGKVEKAKQKNTLICANGRERKERTTTQKASHSIHASLLQVAQNPLLSCCCRELEPERNKLKCFAYSMTQRKACDSLKINLSYLKRVDLKKKKATLAIIIIIIRIC